MVIITTQEKGGTITQLAETIKEAEEMITNAVINNNVLVITIIK